MRLSDEKINYIAFLVTEELEADKRVSFLVSKNMIRASIKQSITSELQLEDEVVKIVLERLSALKSVKKNSPEWEGHFERLYREEMAKRGRDWEISAREVLR